MRVATPLLLICLTIVATAQTPVQTRAFSRVDRIGEASARSFFVFAVGDRNYAIRQDGHGEITAAKFLRWRNFDLKMGAPGRLERLYAAELSGDLLLAYEVTNGNSGWGYVARLDQNERTFRWIAPIPSINIGPGLIEEDYVYLSGQDFLAKIDLQSGKYVWQQTEFDKQAGRAFLDFYVPEINGATVTFRERSASERVIEVDKLTGKILKAQSSIPRQQ
jgi:hypothetical protein